MAFDVTALAVSLRPLAAQYRPDSYQIRRPVNTADNAGGSTTVETIVENGGCILVAGATRPEERAVAAQTGATVPYVLRNIQWNTLLKASDVVTVNSRRFEILGVLRTESANVAVSAIAEERT